MAEAFHAFESGDSSVSPLSAAAVSNQSMQESMRLLLMVRAYQVRWRCCRNAAGGPHSLQGAQAIEPPEQQLKLCAHLIVNTARGPGCLCACSQTAMGTLQPSARFVSENRRRRCSRAVVEGCTAAATGDLAESGGFAAAR